MTQWPGVEHARHTQRVRVCACGGVQSSVRRWAPYLCKRDREVSCAKDRAVLSRASFCSLDPLHTVLLSCMRVSAETPS